LLHAEINLSLKEGRTTGDTAAARAVQAESGALPEMSVRQTIR